MSEVLNIIDVNDYGLQKMKSGGGGGQPNLQSKDITINQNGTTSVLPDTGYDGLSDVDVTVSGILDTSDANATASDILTGKTAYVNGVKLTGAYNPSVAVLPNGIKFSSSTATNMSWLTNVDISNVTSMGNLFYSCSQLTVVPVLNTSNVTSMNQLCYACTRLTTVPALNTSKVTDMANMFYNCSRLTNTSLNNILAMCIGATSYTGTKTLKKIGLSQTQAETCQTLSNWNAFVAAGWSTGY